MNALLCLGVQGGKLWLCLSRCFLDQPCPAHMAATMPCPSQQQTQVSLKVSNHTGLSGFLPYRRRMDNKGNFIIPAVFLICWMVLAGANEGAPTAWQPLAEAWADCSCGSEVLACLPSVAFLPLASLEADFSLQASSSFTWGRKKNLAGAFCE